MFFQNVFCNRKRDPSIQARKKLICRVIVRNYLCNVLRNFLIKIESTWRLEIKDQTAQLTLLYRGRTVRCSHQRCSIKKVVLKYFAILTGKHLCWGPFLIKLQVFRPASFLTRDSNRGVSCRYCEIFKAVYFKKHL